jgi:hypothetical protein
MNRIRSRQLREVNSLEGPDDKFGSLRRYQAATRRTRERFLQSPETWREEESRSFSAQPLAGDSEFVYDANSMIESGFSYVPPAWLRFLLWTGGVGVITFLLILVASFVVWFGSATL